MHVMGPAAHWSTWLPVLAILASVGAAMRLLLNTYSGATLHALGDWLMGFGTGTTTVMVAFGTAQFAQQLRRTRGEQALLRLTPLAGDAALLNRRLAAGMIKAGLVNWAILSAAIVGVTWLLGGGLNGANVYGAWAGLTDASLDQGDVPASNDSFDVLGELVQKRLSVGSLDAVFPGHSYAPLGLATTA